MRTEIKNSSSSGITLHLRSPQLARNAFCPGINSLPVAEVAFGSTNCLHHHALREREFAVIEGPEEDALIAGSEGLLKLRQLLGLLLGVLDIGAEWATAEDRA